MKIIYARGFPYGAPLFILRGGATRDQRVKDFIRAQGFRWDSTRHGWTHYLNRPEAGAILKTLRDDYGCEILPKEKMDVSYRINLDDPKFGRPGELATCGPNCTGTKCHCQNCGEYKPVNGDYCQACIDREENFTEPEQMSLGGEGFHRQRERWS